jgi:N-acetylneuraminate synthase
MSKLFNNLVIFEMANNHQGSIEHGLKIIEYLGEISKKYTLNTAIKLQYRNLDSIIHPDYKDRTDVKHIPRFISTRLMPDQFYTFVCAIREAGMHTMCTPFDEPSVDLCIDHGIEILKVASCSATDWPLLEKVAAAQKPVVISTGGKTFPEIDNIYNFMVHRNVDFSLLHCVGLYPVLSENIQLNCIDRMKYRYPKIPIGYSGHEEPSDFSVVQMAVAKGAQIFERHIGLATDSIKLNAYSTDVRNIDRWVESIQKALKICGDASVKNIPKEELVSMNELARGCYASIPIVKGEALTSDKVFFAMPCSSGQTTSGMFMDGMVASKDYNPGEAVFEKRSVTLANDIRSLIHDVKGMLYEARVILSNDFELELSHHYGLEHFRHFGASIVNVINREYCKKLIVVLPGQKHPVHFHNIKEESFQVIYGTLILTLNGVTKEVNSGDVITVERGAQHAFTSVHGCIFEEISTTHVMNDSYYTDSTIAKKDVMERKTILKEW